MILRHTGPILVAISILRGTYAYNYHSITCRLTLGIDNGQSFARANKSGTIRINDVYNRCCHENIVLGADLGMESRNQIIQCRRNTRWV
jgi:hypothetical protein